MARRPKRDGARRATLAAVAMVVATPLGAVAGAASAAEAPNVVVRVEDEGFDWPSAGIGAASGLGLAVLGGAVVSLLRHPRRRIDR